MTDSHNCECEKIKIERLTFLLGTVMGQMSQLLNYMQLDGANINISYESLCDIQKSAALQINEIYYKNNKPK